MSNLLTTLGEGRAYTRIYSQAYPVRPSTARRYMEEYARYLDGITPETAPSPEAGMWAMAGIRYGALSRLAEAVPILERAIEAGDTAAADTAGRDVRACLATLERYPPKPMGRRVRPSKGSPMTVTAATA
jgi:hypothetical protein